MQDVKSTAYEKTWDEAAYDKPSGRMQDMQSAAYEETSDEGAYDELEDAAYDELRARGAGESACARALRAS